MASTANGVNVGPAVTVSATVAGAAVAVGSKVFVGTSVGHAVFVGALIESVGFTSGTALGGTGALVGGVSTGGLVGAGGKADCPSPTLFVGGPLGVVGG